MNTPYSKYADGPTQTEQPLPRLGFILLVFSSQCNVCFDRAILQFGDADDLHDFIVGANDVLDDFLSLRVDDASLLVVLSLRLMRISLACPSYNIIVRRTTL